MLKHTTHITLGGALSAAAKRIDRLDARLLLEAVCGLTHAALITHPERGLSAAQAAQFEALVRRRAAGEPFAYLVGESSFYGYHFKVSPAVLIPREDTGVLVEQALHWLKQGFVPAQVGAVPSVLDLGTGSGIVAIVLKHLCPEAQISALDFSLAALAVAQENALLHQLELRFVHSDWYTALGAERFDLIVSNPPYIAAGDPHLALNGLPFEPLMALVDQDFLASDAQQPQNAKSAKKPQLSDGLACIRAIIGGARTHLLANGALLIEHGYDQACAVRGLLKQAGFAQVASWPDSANIERVSGGVLSANSTIP